MKFIFLAAAAALLTGCVTSNQNDLGESFGVATAANNAAQIVDPTPAAGAPEGDATAVDLATARYKTDKVKQPKSGKFTPGGDTPASQ